VALFFVHTSSIRYVIFIPYYAYGLFQPTVSLHIFWVINPINSFFLFVHNPKTSQKMLLTYISLCGAAFLFGGELSRLANISAHFIYGLPMFFTWVVSVINSTAQPTTKTPGVHFTNQDII